MDNHVNDSDKPMRDHRAEDRVRTKVPLVEPEVGGRLIDMSRSGISFHTTHEYSVGDQIDMHFRVGSLDEPGRLEFHCKGEVVRVTPSEGGFVVAGSIQWLDD